MPHSGRMGLMWGSNRSEREIQQSVDLRFPLSDALKIHRTYLWKCWGFFLCFRLFYFVYLKGVSLMIHLWNLFIKLLIDGHFYHVNFPKKKEEEDRKEEKEQERKEKNFEGNKNSLPKFLSHCVSSVILNNCFSISRNHTTWRILVPHLKTNSLWPHRIYHLEPSVFLDCVARFILIKRITLKWWDCLAEKPTLL